MDSIETKDFSLHHTVESGQIFRFKKQDNGYIIAHADKIFFVRQKNDLLEFKGCSEKFITNFFALDIDINHILQRINKDKHMQTAINNCRGLRIIRQDPWECIISFICSANANIPKIQNNLFLLSQSFGKKKKFEGREHFIFPQIGKINNLEKIRKASTGYRDKYIFETNKLLDNNKITEIQMKNYENAKIALQKLPGVGPKVADCVLLFAFQHNNAFPIDTWIKKGMQELYFNNKETSLKQIQEFSQKYFGEYAGYAQQYLFHDLRNRK